MKVDRAKVLADPSSRMCVGEREIEECSLIRLQISIGKTYKLKDRGRYFISENAKILSDPEGFEQFASYVQNEMSKTFWVTQY